jgi:hypothetical protein
VKSIRGIASQRFAPLTERMCTPSERYDARALADLLREAAMMAREYGAHCSYVRDEHARSGDDTTAFGFDNRWKHALSVATALDDLRRGRRFVLPQPHRDILLDALKAALREVESLPVTPLAGRQPKAG